jgi:hypothetical protein
MLKRALVVLSATAVLSGDKATGEQYQADVFDTNQVKS